MGGALVDHAAQLLLLLVAFTCPHTPRHRRTNVPEAGYRNDRKLKTLLLDILDVQAAAKYVWG